MPREAGRCSLQIVSGRPSPPVKVSLVQAHPGGHSFVRIELRSASVLAGSGAFSSIDGRMAQPAKRLRRMSTAGTDIPTETKMRFMPRLRVDPRPALAGVFPMLCLRSPGHGGTCGGDPDDPGNGCFSSLAAPAFGRPRFGHGAPWRLRNLAPVGEPGPRRAGRADRGHSLA